MKRYLMQLTSKSSDEVELIKKAAQEVKQSKSSFMLLASLEKARKVLGEKDA